MHAGHIESARDWAARLVVHVLRRIRASSLPHAALRRTAATIASNCLRTIHRFDSGNRAMTCAVFLTRYRNRIFARPKCRLITRVLHLRAHAGFAVGLPITVCTRPLLPSTPMWTFIPSNHWCPSSSDASRRDVCHRHPSSNRAQR